MNEPITHPELEQFIDSISDLFEGEILQDSISKAIYSTDASLYQLMPIAVLIPKTISDVKLAVKEAIARNIPIIPRGGGTSLAGQAIGHGVVLDFSKYLNVILAINAPERWAMVQPGVVLDTLNAKLRPFQLQFGPDPATSSRATLGGIVANNTTGTHSILYGSAIDHVLALDVLLFDGSEVTLSNCTSKEWEAKLSLETTEGKICRQIDALLQQNRSIIEKDTPTHWRRQGGFRLERLLNDEKNLAHLFCGSEGTLGVIIGIQVNLVDLPKFTGVGVIHFEDRKSSLSHVTALLATNPAAIEMLDYVALDRCKEVPELARKLSFIQGNPNAILITEYYGETVDEVEQQLEALRKTTEVKEIGYALYTSTDRREISHIWEVRKAGLGLAMGVKGDYKPVAFVEDAAVPVEHLATYIEDFDAILSSTDTKSVIYGHASAGCLHLRPFINTRDAKDVSKMKELALASATLVKKYGGIISSEHGDGIVRAWLNEDFYGEELYSCYRTVKEIFDPNHCFNPNKIIDAPAMTENLRLGPTHQRMPLKTQLAYPEIGSFAEAVELCNGAGACRKPDKGTMCPSYMATRDETHSTRGRANALRHAISGSLPESTLTSKEIFEVMELCIECKACKSECPSSVDMAKIKFEWLGQYWEKHHKPMRERLFTEIPKLAKLISGPLAPFVNKINGSAATRAILDKTLGISKERSLPKFARKSFLTWAKAHPSKKQEKKVVLFADTFNTFIHPEVSRAAYLFLQKMGYEVIIAGNKCCGRPYISKGFIKEAKRAAKDVVDILHPYAKDGLKIVGLEPSCVLSLKDEYLAMLPDDEKAHLVATNAVTFEEFVSSSAKNGELDHLKWKPVEKNIILHGHCHQKALVGMSPAFHILSLSKNHQIEFIDAGCCGMAGAFGYEKEHFTLSSNLANRKLIPKIKENPSATVVASGVSCREQIQHFGSKKALHPAQLLLNALE